MNTDTDISFEDYIFWGINENDNEHFMNELCIIDAILKMYCKDIKYFLPDNISSEHDNFKLTYMDVHTNYNIHIIIYNKKVINDRNYYGTQNDTSIMLYIIDTETNIEHKCFENDFRLNGDFDEKNIMDEKNIDHELKNELFCDLSMLHTSIHNEKKFNTFISVLNDKQLLNKHISKNMQIIHNLQQNNSKFKEIIKLSKNKYHGIHMKKRKFNNNNDDNIEQTQMFFEMMNKQEKRINEQEKKIQAFYNENLKNKQWETKNKKNEISTSTLGVMVSLMGSMALFGVIHSMKHMK